MGSFLIRYIPYVCGIEVDIKSNIVGICYLFSMRVNTMVGNITVYVKLTLSFSMVLTSRMLKVVVSVMCVS